MKNYEGLFILKPDLAKEQLAELYQKINDNIKKYDGKTEGAEEWGKRRLAYRLGKYREGVYYLLRFKIAPDKIKPLNSDFKLNESVMRVVFTNI